MIGAISVISISVISISVINIRIIVVDCVSGGIFVISVILLLDEP